MDEVEVCLLEFNQGARWLLDVMVKRGYNNVDYEGDIQGDSRWARTVANEVVFAYVLPYKCINEVVVNDVSAPGWRAPYSLRMSSATSTAAAFDACCMPRLQRRIVPRM